MDQESRTLIREWMFTQEPGKQWLVFSHMSQLSMKQGEKFQLRFTFILIFLAQELERDISVAQVT